MGPKSGPRLGFLSFFRFGSLVFLEIAYNISFQQCLTSSRSKTYKKKKTKVGQNGLKSAQNYIFSLFLKFGSLVSFEIAYINSFH